MDRATLERLIAAHASFPRALEGLISGTDLELLRSRPDEQRWSPLEILVHLLDEESLDFRPRARAAAEEAEIEQAIAPQAWVSERAYNARDPQQALASFARERELSCQWLRDLDTRWLARRARHRKLGEMTCADFIAAWRMHDLLHLRQLATTLLKLTARRLEGHDIGYAGRIPQDL